MTTEGLGKNTLENNEIPQVVPENIKQNEISPEEFSNWLDSEENTFKNETVEESNKVNSIGLDEPTFEKIKNETGFEQELHTINQEASKVISDTKQELGEESISPEKPKEELDGKETTQINLDETYMQHGIDAFLNSSEKDKNTIQRDFLKNFQTTMKIEEFKKVTPYIRSEHQTINGLLRQDKKVNIENVLQYKGKELSDINKEWNADVVESFQALEDCIEKSQFTVPEEGVGKKVYRVINGDHLADFNQGDTITEKSFLSTSLDESYKDWYLNDADEETILTIKFPDNSKVSGICIGNVENEFLLPRNMSYKIIDKKVSVINGVKKFEINAEFLPNEHVRVQEA